MQNKASWLETTPEGYKVRVQFMPVNDAEHKRISALLSNPDVRILSTTNQGPMTMDMLFTPSTGKKPNSTRLTVPNMIKILEDAGFTVVAKAKAEDMDAVDSKLAAQTTSPISEDSPALAPASPASAPPVLNAGTANDPPPTAAPVSFDGLAPLGALPPTDPNPTSTPDTIPSIKPGAKIQ